MKVKTIKTPWSFTAPRYVDRDKIAAGDYYGTGLKPKVGSPRSSYMIPNMNEKQLKDPPMKLG